MAQPRRREILRIVWSEELPATPDFKTRVEHLADKIGSRGLASRRRSVSVRVKAASFARKATKALRDAK